MIEKLWGGSRTRQEGIRTNHRAIDGTQGLSANGKKQINIFIQRKKKERKTYKNKQKYSWKKKCSDDWWGGSRTRQKSVRANHGIADGTQGRSANGKWKKGIKKNVNWKRK